MCVNGEGSGETVRMRRLAWAYVIGTILSWAGSNEIWKKQLKIQAASEYQIVQIGTFNWIKRFEIVDFSNCSSF